jgi:MFS family permease
MLDQGVISLILTMPAFREQFPEIAPNAPGYGFNTGFMTGMLELGAFIGCLIFPYVADRLSRKWGLSFATAFFCLGAIIQTAAMNYDTLVAGRFLGGMGVGMLAMGAPLYISEIAPPNLRGSLLVLEAFFIIVGAIVAYWLTFGTRCVFSAQSPWGSSLLTAHTRYIDGDWGFRLPFLLQMIPALIVGCGIHLFPHSPRWLAMRDRNEESLEALAKLRRLPTSHEMVQEEWREIMFEVRFQSAVIQQEHPRTNMITSELMQWVDLFRPRYLRRTAVALAIPFFQQVFSTVLSDRTHAELYCTVFWNQCVCVLRSDLLRCTWTRQ